MANELKGQMGGVGPLLDADVAEEQRRTVAASDAMSLASNSPAAGRVHWIDLAKGAGILLVAMGHLTTGSGESVWLPKLWSMHYGLYLFHMPLFFLLGGLVLNPRGRTLREVVTSRARVLLVSYYVFSLYFLAKPLATAILPGLAKAFGIEAGPIDLAATLKSVLITGDGLWFLWAYFWAQVIAFAVTSWTTGKMGEAHRNLSLGIELVLGCVFVLLAQSWHIGYEGADPPFQLLRGIWGAGYVLIGHVIATVIGKPGRGVCLVLGAICLVAFLQVDLSLVGDREPSLWGAWLWGDPYGIKSSLVSLEVALLGSLAVLFFARAWNRCEPLESVGRESLAYYALSPFVMNACKLLVFTVLGVSLADASGGVQLAFGLALAISSVALSSPFVRLIDRHAPWLFGRSTSSY